MKCTKEVMKIIINVPLSYCIAC